MWHKIGITHTRKYVWVFFLWIMFSVGCLVAPFVALLIPIMKNSNYVQKFVRAADRLCAAMLGFSGRNMLSTELAHSDRLSWMRKALNDIQDNHCEHSAYEEGAYCRISDHTLGSK